MLVNVGLPGEVDLRLLMRVLVHGLLVDADVEADCSGSAPADERGEGPAVELDVSVSVAAVADRAPTLDVVATLELRVRFTLMGPLSQIARARSYSYLCFIAALHNCYLLPLKLRMRSDIGV